MEDIIKGRIVFDGGGMAGGVAGATKDSSSMTGSVMSKRGIMGAVTLPITDVLSGILSGIKKMGEWSPMLGAELIRMRKGLQLFLMPIGDTLANWVRPMAQGWVDSASVFYEAYKSGGFWAGMRAAMGEVWDNLGWVDESGHINFTGILENIDDLLTIASVLLVGSALIGGGFSTILGLLGSVFGLTVGANALLIPAALFLGSKIVGDLLGLDEGSGIIAAIATAVGIGTTMVAGIGIAWSIPIALTFVGLAALLKEMGDALAEQTGGGQKWVGPDISGPDFATSQEAVADFAMTDITKGQGTIGYQLNELTGELEIVKTTAETMSEGMTTFFETSDEFKPMRDRIAKMVSESFDVEMVGSMPWSANLASENMITSFGNVGKEIDIEKGKVDILTKLLNALPNITRTITYKIKYVTEG